MKRKGIIFLCCICISGYLQLSHAQDSSYSTLTLKQSVDLALANNIPLKQSSLLTDRARIDQQQAKENLLPTLNGSFNHGFNSGRTIDPITNSYINQKLSSSNLNLNAGLLLFNGFLLQNIIKQTSFAYEASRMETQQVKDNLTLNVVLAYLTVLSDEDILEISVNQSGVTRKQMERMEILVKEGAVGSYQLADLRGQLAGDELNIITAKNTLQNSKLTLCQLLNIPYNPDLKLDRSEIQLPVEKYPLGSDQIFEAGIHNLALIKAVDLRVRSAEKNIKAVQGNYYPSISLGANYNTRYSSGANAFIPTTTTEIQTGDYVKISGTSNPVLRLEQNYAAEKVRYFDQFKNNRGTYYGIGMQVPIFNNFQVRNRVKIARILLKNSEYEAANTKLILKQNVELAYQNMNASFERYKILTEQVINYEETFRAAEIRFISGVINSTEYVLIKNTLDRARTNLAQAKYEFIFRSRILDFYQGRLVL